MATCGNCQTPAATVAHVRECYAARYSADAPRGYVAPVAVLEPEALLPQDTCRYCATRVEYRRVAGSSWRSEYVHTADGSTSCPGGYACPVATCPVETCRSTSVVHSQQAWGNATDCPACGYHDFRSIGD